MKKKILFIVNRKSGVKGKASLPALIDSYIYKNSIDHEIVFTKAPKHGTQLSHEAALKDYDVVVAVGGDGSVNEVAKGLLGFKTALGIIPNGSGNGLARHLKIPMDHKDAIEVINKGKAIKIDTFKINDEVCVGTFGIGFDGHVAHLFAHSSKRGYSTYAKIVLREFYKYKPVKYEMKIDEEDFSKECFLLTFANSSQFGNDAAIAPFADIQDGLLDITMISKFPLVTTPRLIYRLMNTAIHKSRFVTMKKAKEVVLKNNTQLCAHIDGEPVTFSSNLHIKIVPLSLNVLVPQ